MNKRALLDRLYNEQAEWVFAHLSQQQADEANYGWGQSDLVVTTKVYGEDGGYLTSIIHTDGTISHDFKAFN